MTATTDVRPEFAGLSALVTGGSSGIGLATAQLLVELGARVAVIDIGAGPRDGRILGLIADVTDQQAVHRAVARTVEEFGGLDVVVNNAGVGAIGGVEDNDDQQWLRLLDVNVLGVVRTSRAALPHLRRSPSPTIVNTASVAATTGLPRRAAYSASKGAVYALTLAMAADLVAERIRVNCVCPGTADTPWVARLLDASEDPERERAALEARQPLGRLATAREVARAIVHLASPESGFTTGTALVVDGGLSHLRLPSG